MWPNTERRPVEKPYVDAIPDADRISFTNQRDGLVTTTVLAWTVQVNDVAMFIAHLEAYTELSPTLSLLKLHHRFGQGSLNLPRLPMELLIEIEGYIIAEVRAAKLEDCRREYDCFMHTCNGAEHLDSEEFDEVIVPVLKEHAETCEACSHDEPERCTTLSECKAEINEWVWDCGFTDNNWRHDPYEQRWMQRTKSLVGARRATPGSMEQVRLTFSAYSVCWNRLTNTVATISIRPRSVRQPCVDGLRHHLSHQSIRLRRSAVCGASESR